MSASSAVCTSSDQLMGQWTIKLSLEEKERAEGTEARAAIGCSLNNTGYEVGICRRPLLRSAPRTLQCPGPAGFVATLHRCTARYVPLISISKCATHIKSLHRCNAALLVRGHRFAIAHTMPLMSFPRTCRLCLGSPIRGAQLDTLRPTWDHQYQCQCYISRPRCPPHT